METKALPIRFEFFTVRDAAVYLNCSEKTVRRFLDRGLLRSSKATRKKLIPRRDLETFFERTQ
jgi:excisionase family DNA binding protein